MAGLYDSGRESRSWNRKRLARPTRIPHLLQVCETAGSIATGRHAHCQATPARRVHKLGSMGFTRFLDMEKRRGLTKSETRSISGRTANGASWIVWNPQ